MTLTEGGHQDITLLLEKDPNAVAALPAATAPVTPAAVPPPEPAAAKNYTPAYVAYGVGAAGLLVGTVTGVLAMSKASDCPNKVCATQSDLDSAKSMATVSTITFGIGIAGAAVGTILLFTANKNEASPAQAKAHTQPKLSLHPFVGVGSLGLSGTFQ